MLWVEGLKTPSGNACTVSVVGTPSGVITLGQVAARLPVLEVACNRRGRLRTDRLVLEHGIPSQTWDNISTDRRWSEGGVTVTADSVGIAIEHRCSGLQERTRPALCPA